jgi:hypothetical protein
MLGPLHHPGGVEAAVMEMIDHQQKHQEQCCDHEAHIPTLRRASLKRAEVIYADLAMNLFQIASKQERRTMV